MEKFLFYTLKLAIHKNDKILWIRVKETLDLFDIKILIS